MYSIEITVIVNGKKLKTEICKSIYDARKYLTQVENAFHLVQHNLKHYISQTRKD